jgi:hypothetical protein
MAMRGRWAKSDLPVMTDAEVNEWIEYNKVASGRTYSQMLDDFTKQKTQHWMGAPATNIDNIIAKLEVLVGKEKIDEINTRKGTTLAVRDVLESRGQTGDRTESPIADNVLGFLGVPKPRAGKRRTLKKRKQKKRTVKRKH